MSYTLSEKEEEKYGKSAPPVGGQVKMVMVHAIIGLLEKGWRYRRIARELGVHRDTVARYDRLRKTSDLKPLKKLANYLMSVIRQSLLCQKGI